MNKLHLQHGLASAGFYKRARPQAPDVKAQERIDVEPETSFQWPLEPASICVRKRSGHCVHWLDPPGTRQLMIQTLLK